MKTLRPALALTTPTSTLWSRTWWVALTSSRVGEKEKNELLGVLGRDEERNR
jgi:hypothetical protein